MGKNGIQINKNDLINKFLSIEQWAYRGRHLVEVMDAEKLKNCCLRMRHNLEDLEVILKVD